MGKIKGEKSDSSQVFCVGSVDTKLQDLQYLSHAVRSNLTRFSIISYPKPKVQITVVDVSVGPNEIEKCEGFDFVPRKDVLACYSGLEEQSGIVVLPEDHGEALAIMEKAFANFLQKAYEDRNLAGVVGLGGSETTFLLSSAFGSLPKWIPQLIVSTVPAGPTGSYVGTSDLVLFASVADACGINSVSKVILSNAAAAFAGMLIQVSDRTKYVGSSGLKKLSYQPEGYNYWTWRGHKMHYVEEGEGMPILLIHGYGASAYHWRYNIPELAKKYKVYALDLLGFGWSEKVVIDYDASVWKDQVMDFVKEIVETPTILVGNGLGGFTALEAASEMPDKVRGVVLLNSSGQFEDANMENKESEETGIAKYIFKPVKDACAYIFKPVKDACAYIFKPVDDAYQRVLHRFLFWVINRPDGIETCLKEMYINASNVDDYLINSILRPQDDPNAREIHYRLVTHICSSKRKYTLNSVLNKLSCPLLLIWGDLDIFFGPAKARQIKEFYSNTSVVNLQAGHCPHDEVPEKVNEALLEWLPTVGVASTPASQIL